MQREKIGGFIREYGANHGAVRRIDNPARKCAPLPFKLKYGFALGAIEVD
jgi:hypothetical protein